MHDAPDCDVRLDVVKPCNLRRVIVIVPDMFDLVTRLGRDVRFLKLRTISMNAECCAFLRSRCATDDFHISKIILTLLFNQSLQRHTEEIRKLRVRTASVSTSQQAVDPGAGTVPRPAAHHRRVERRDAYSLNKLYASLV